MSRHEARRRNSEAPLGDGGSDSGDLVIWRSGNCRRSAPPSKHHKSQFATSQMTRRLAVNRPATAMSRYAGPLPCGRGSAPVARAARWRNITNRKSPLHKWRGGLAGGRDSRGEPGREWNLVPAAARIFGASPKSPNHEITKYLRRLSAHRPTTPRRPRHHRRKPGLPIPRTASDPAAVRPSPTH